MGDAAAAEEAEEVFQSGIASMDGAPLIHGEDSFVFLGDDYAENFSQALGRRYLSEAELAAWSDSLRALQAGLDDQGIPLLILIAPAKWSIYPEKLPDWSRSITGTTPFDQLLNANPDLPIVDVRLALQDAASTTPVYSAVNSHWSDYGSLVAWNQSAACIDSLYPTLAPTLTLTAKSIGTATFNEFEPFGVESPQVPDWTTVEFAEDLAMVTVADSTNGTTTVPGGTRFDLTALPGTTYTPDADNAQTALIFRDSFGTMMSAEWAQAYEATVQLRHGVNSPSESQPDIPSLVTEHRPDIVIYQVAERYLSHPPPVIAW